MSAIFVGVDPGIAGALAIVTTYNDGNVFDLPVVGHRLDAKIFCGMLRPVYASVQAKFDTCHVILEHAQSMPGQSAPAMFNYGINYGIILGVLSVLELSYTEVRPNVWKKALHLGKEKEQSRLRAMQLFPSVDLHRKKDHNKAEALLLAWYGEHVFQTRKTA